nr:aminodeoxychorismate synthase component I [Rhodoferax sp.]
MRALIDFAAIQAPPPLPHAHTPTPGKALPAGSGALRVAFGEPVEVLEARSLNEVKNVLQAVEERALRGQWCVGYVRYEAAPAFDSALAVHPATGPLAWFGVHDAPLPSAEEAPSAPPADTPQNTADTAGGTRRATWQPGMARAPFDAALSRLHQAITDGEIYQANFTARNEGQLHVPPWELFTAMRQAQPGGFAAYIDTGDEQVLSVSPELFFDWHDGHIVTRPMKGTAPRGRTPDEDTALAAALRSSPKERAENVMIVDLIRNDLSRLAQPFSVTVDGLCRVQALSTVWQMVTDVHADTRPGTRLVDVFTALFPCGSVTGAPKVQAMRLIRELENTDRAVYCGAVGVVRPGGSATFNVPIRTVLAQGSHLRTGTGSGITSDAEAAGEWQEWRHKQTYLTRASQSFELLETLALNDGVLQHVGAHLARMAASATHFGFAWRPEAVQQTLAALSQQHPSGDWRVRLLLDVAGTPRVEAFALPATPSTVRLQLAASPLLQATSEFVRHKTTRRAHYEQFAPTNPTIFDTVLWNTNGEITECTRGNIALLLDGRWVTPAAGCGLLPGVGRAHWLAEKRLEEAVVHLNDLQRVDAMAFVNSLRGWVDSVWDAPPQVQNLPTSWDDGEHGALQPG